MKASELRIGNETSKGTIVSFYEHGIHVGFGKCFKFNELDPIPITEEWLLKFGFVNDGVIAYRYELDDVQYDLDDNTVGLGLSFAINWGIVTEPMHYVHQLQNLYFSLTGKELI